MRQGRGREAGLESVVSVHEGAHSRREKPGVKRSSSYFPEAPRDLCAEAAVFVAGADGGGAREKVSGSFRRAGALA